MTISDFIERKMKEFEKRFTVKTFSTTGEMRIMAGGKIQEGKMLVYHTGEVSAKPIVDFLRTFSQELIEKCGEEIIGEDELPEEYIAKHLTEIELDKTIQAVNFHARNKLRAEQRSHLKGISL